MPTTRHLKIFISSTFQDMHNEREILLKDTFLELKKIAKNRDIEVTEIDLRTGVTQEQAESGQIVKICLDEIERCADSPIFFLGILANRYGWSEWLTTVDRAVLEDEKYKWIEEHQDVSITEIEIISALERDNRHNKALFYFKEHKENDDKRLIELKSRLIDKSKTDNNLSIEKYKNGEEFREKTINSFKKALDELFPEDEKLSEVEKLRASHQTFAKSRQKIYIPYEENETILSKFIDSQEDRLLLYGESGYGKSALIANYFEQFKKEKSHFVIEHYIGGAGELSNDLHQMLRRIMLEIKKEFKLDDELPTEPQKILDEFALWLHRVERPTIIVLDGYNQIEDELREKLFYYLPEKFENVKLIITSIKDDYSIEYKQEIKALTENEQKELIEKYLKYYGKTLNTTTLQEIVSHPQTNNTLFLKTLLDEIRLLGVFEKLSDDIANYLTAKDVVELFSKIFERLERDYKSNLAKEVLSLLYISRDGLSEDNLMEILNQNGEVARLEFSPLFLAIEEHLVDRGGLYGFVHGFIEEAVKGRYLDDTELVNGYRRRIADYFEPREIDNQRVRELPFQLFELRDSEGLYLNLIDVNFFTSVQKMDDYELLKYIKLLEKSTYSNIGEDITHEIVKETHKVSLEKLSQDIDNLALFFYEIYPKYNLALAIYQYSLKIRQRDFGDEHIYTAEGYNNMGTIYDAIGQYANALKVYEKSLSIRKKNLGTEHLDTAESYLNLALFYENMSEYDKSLALYLKALTIKESHLDNSDPNLGALYNNLAELYRLMSSFDNALKFYEKDLEICKKNYPQNHHNIAIYYNNRALLYEAQGDYQNAISFNTNALSIYQKVLGEEHPDTATSYNNLAGVYRLVGRYDEAILLYDISIKIRKKILGETHSWVATSYNNLAEVYRLKGEYFESLPLFYKALAIYGKSFQEEHLSIAIVYNNLGLSYKYIGDYEKSLFYSLKALNIRKKILGEEHLETSVSYNNLALLYLDMRHYKKALPFSKKDLKIIKNIFGELHPDVATTYNNLGGVLEGLNKYHQALILYNKSLLIRKKILEKVHPHIAENYQNLSILYEKQKKYRKGLFWGYQALNLRKKIYGEENTFTVDSYYVLGNIYVKIKKYKKALNYYKKALKVRKKVLGEKHYETIETIVSIKRLLRKT